MRHVFQTAPTTAAADGPNGTVAAGEGVASPRAHALRAVRRAIRPLVISMLRALPSPEGCGCQARKDWLIRQIEAI